MFSNVYQIYQRSAPRIAHQGSHQRHCSAAAGSRTSDGDAGPFVKEKDADAKPLNISTESL